VVQRGTGTRVLALKRPIGGKTGTTNSHRDAWFIGFTPSLITGVWVGMDSELILGDKETGSQAAAPVFIDYMKEALKNQPAESFGEGVKAPGKSRQLDDDEDDELDNDVVFQERKSVTSRR
jgi:penicillin-binding protein 1A